MTKPIKIGATAIFNSDKGVIVVIDILNPETPRQDKIGEVKMELPLGYQHLIPEFEKLINKLEKK